MSYYLFKIGQNRLEYHLNTFTKETVKLNGRIVSEGMLNQAHQLNKYEVKLKKQEDLAGF